MSDYQATLDEISQVLNSLQPAVPRAEEFSDLVPPKVGSRRSQDRVPKARTMAPDRTGGYLDERLATARALAAAVDGEIAVLERRMGELRADSERMDRELRMASEELAFIRREPWELRRPGNALLADYPVDPDDDRAPSVRSDPADPVSSASLPPEQRFTKERYQRTIRSLIGRRRALAVATVLLSIGVSAALFWVTLRYAHPASAPWIGMLPFVWLIPIPFFLGSFIGSQQILSTPSLLLEE